MRHKEFWRVGLLAVLLAMGGMVAAFASPWAETGDNQLRADIELLARTGVIDDVTGQWPLPWTAILGALDDRNLADKSAAIRAAASRVVARARAENPAGLAAGLVLDTATSVSPVYGFDGMGRGVGQAQATIALNLPSTMARLSLGAFSPDGTSHGLKLMPDDSFISQKLGNAMLYAGWVSHWWGPGWVSALALSDNARPMPQIGIQRLSSAAFNWPVLSWFGPWQADFFVGLLDGPRFDHNTGYDAFHISFNPLPGLEIGLARTEQICGQHHPCVPLRDTVDLNNDPTHVNRTNDEGEIDVRYSHSVWGVPAEIYMSLMNEDSSPFTHSDTTHLFGATFFLPTAGNPLRLTAEYTDSVPTLDIFSFGDVGHGNAYTNGGYPDGMRYRNRTLGFSLDSDSRLLTLQGGWSDAAGRFYELSYHHAVISNPNNSAGNVVTSAPVIINLGEARMTLPLRWLKLDLAGRLQDDQPRPHRGFEASFETALRVNF